MGHKDQASTGEREHVVIDTDDIDVILFENQSVPAGEVITSDWLDISFKHEVTIYVQSVKNFTTSIQLTDDNVSADPDAFTLCAKDGNGTAVSITTVNEGKCYTFTTNAAKMRVMMRNNDASASDTPYAAVK